MTSSLSSSSILQSRPSRIIGLRVFVTLVVLAMSVAGIGVPAAAAAAAPPAQSVSVGATPSVQINLCLLQPNGDWPWKCPR